MLTPKRTFMLRAGTLTLLLLVLLSALAPVAVAQPPVRPGMGPPISPPPVQDDGLSRLVIALGVLLVLAQAAERLTQLLRTLLQWFGCKWAAASDSAPQQEARAAGVDDVSRAMRLNVWSVLSGMIVAFVCRIDAFDLFSTGQATVHTLAGNLPGIIATGLIASMGSAFLHDLISIVQALKDTKDELAKQEKLNTGKKEKDA